MRRQKPDIVEVNREDLFETSSLRSLTAFWFGVALYVLVVAISATGFVNFIIAQLILLGGLALTVYASLFTLRWRSDNIYLRNVFVIYMTWLVLVILRGRSFDYETIKYLLVLPNGMLAYLAPLAMLLPVTPKSFKKVFGTCSILVILFVVVCFYYSDVVIHPQHGMRLATGAFEGIAHALGVPIGFVLLTFPFHKKKVNVIAIVGILFLFVLSAIRARRALMFMSGTMMLSTILIYLRIHKGSIINTIMTFFVVVIMIGAGYMVFQSNKSGIFGLAASRVNEDTRSYVEEAFYANMDAKGWLFGRGINGVYYCPGIEDGLGQNVTVFRDVIETGYLQVILEGGLVSLVLFLMLAVPAIVKGFRSSNFLCKACSTWILLFLSYTYPTTVHLYSMQFLILWLCVAINFNDEMRALTDEELIGEFNE